MSALPELRLEIPGVPSTNHRARSYLGDDGKIHHRGEKDFRRWKRFVRERAALTRPRGWPQHLRYAVEVIGFMPSERYDADNLRGVLDALEGILWRNDRQVRPVNFDYAVDAAHPRIVVQVVAYDPAETVAEIHIVLRHREAP